MGKESAREKGKFLESLAGALRDFSVDERDFGAFFFGDCQEMVPEIAFTEDERCGLDALDEPPDDPREI